MSVNRNKHFQSFTVGKLDAGMILIGERAHLIEFPSLLLPPGTVSGSIVSISVLRDHAAERSHASSFAALQADILDAYGTRSPTAPVLSLLNTTQTSVTLEWGALDLASASLRSVEIYRNGTRLAGIPNPSHNTSTKLSSLQLDTDYTFQLVMKTSAGTYPSNVVRVRTHTMNDTSGISVCFGNVQDSNLLHQAQVALDQMGARYSDKIHIDTTHFVCTTPAGSTGSGPSVEYQKALQLTLPVVEPGWIFACLQEKKMVPISQHLLGSNSTYNPVNNASFARLSQTAGSEPVPSRNNFHTAADDDAEIVRQPSPETRARSSIPDGMSPGSVAGDEDERPVFERPPSTTGGKLNRGFKFPLSTEALVQSAAGEDAVRRAPSPKPVIAEAVVIHESESDAEATAAPSFAPASAPTDDKDTTPTASSAEFETVDVNAPSGKEVAIVAAPGPGAAEPQPAAEVLEPKADDRPRLSVPELIFSPPPEDEVQTLAVSPAAELEASTSAEVEKEVEPTAAETDEQENLAEELVQPATEEAAESKDVTTDVPKAEAAAPVQDPAPVSPAAELEAATLSETKPESEPTPEEARDEAQLTEDLVEPASGTATPTTAEDASTEGVASAHATDDDGGDVPAVGAEEGSGGAESPAGSGAAGSDAKKAKKKKKGKKSKSIAK